jgi:hypothetical protein
MPDRNTMLKVATEKVRARQKIVGRILINRGLTLQAVSDASGIGYSTILSYFSQEQYAVLSAIPVAALTLLFGVIPDDILSHLTEPEGRCFHGTTEAEREAEARLIAIRDMADATLAAMRGNAVGQEQLFGEGAG